VHGLAQTAHTRSVYGDAHAQRLLFNGVCDQCIEPPDASLRWLCSLVLLLCAGLRKGRLNPFPSTSGPKVHLLLLEPEAPASPLQTLLLCPQRHQHQCQGPQPPRQQPLLLS